MHNLIVVFGLSGSGKSFVSRILKEEFNYEWIRSDEVRKKLAGIEPQRSAKAEFGKGIYTEEMTKRVYKKMIEEAKELISKGKKVVLDATFLKRWQRELVRENFKESLFILVKAEEGEIKRRLETRKDISDADFNIYLKQKEVFEFPEGEEFIEFDTTNKSKEEIISFLKNLLKD